MTDDTVQISGLPQITQDVVCVSDPCGGDPSGTSIYAGEGDILQSSNRRALDVTSDFLIGPRCCAL